MSKNDELACTYACLLLNDDGLAITADRINAVLKAAGVSVEPIYPTLFAKFLEKTNISSLLSNVSTAGAAAPAAAAPAAAAAAPAKEAAKETKKEAKKEEKEEEEDGDMGFGLFD